MNKNLEVIECANIVQNKMSQFFMIKTQKGIREVVVEHDGTLSIGSNDYDREEDKKTQAIGFPWRESSLMTQYSISVKINYCPERWERLKKACEKSVRLDIWVKENKGDYLFMCMHG